MFNRSINADRVLIDFVICLPGRAENSQTELIKSSSSNGRISFWTQLKTILLLASQTGVFDDADCESSIRYLDSMFDRSINIDRLLVSYRFFVRLVQNRLKI